MKRPYLKKGIVPSQFPNCPSYLSKRKRQRKSPNKRNPIVKKQKVQKKNLEFQEFQDNPESEVIPPKKDETVDSESVSRTKLFNLLFNTKESIDIPISWCRRQTENDIACIELTHSISRMVNGELKFLTSKQIIISKDMQVNAKVAGMPLPLEKLGCNTTYVSSVRELEKIITNFNHLKVCLGCASPDSVRNIETSFAIRDSSGYLRHLKCSLVVKNETKRSCCETCKKGKKSLTQKTIRMQKMTDHKRLVLQMSPAKKKKLRVLRNRLYNAKRRGCHYERLYHHYKTSLQKSREEIASLEDESLKNKLSEANVSKNERTVIDEIIAASKVTSSKGRRYSEDWIVLCLLFHMRSPAAYRLLRDNKILPLPARSTISR